MGILNQTQNEYYNNSSNFGNYQFTSLDDIINQFMIAYIGEEKIIGKASRTDVAFHAQRAMQELSFDTFKSIKSQEIELPPSLTMILPHDYVNYTRVMWSDAAGIKHPLYPTRDTQNPFKIQQLSNGQYDFKDESNSLLINNSTFSDNLDSATNFSFSQGKNTRLRSSATSSAAVGTDLVETSGGQLIFKNFFETKFEGATKFFNHHYAVWQLLEFPSQTTMVDLKADGLATSSGTDKGPGVLRVGLTTAITGTQLAGSWGPNDIPEYDPSLGYDPSRTNPELPGKPSFNMDKGVYNLSTTQAGIGYMEFSPNDTLEEKNVYDIDISNLPLNANGKKEVYLLIVSSNGLKGVNAAASTQKVDNIEIFYDGISDDLIEGGESTTWSNYKSQTPNENVNPEVYSYDTDIYDFNMGERYGLDPQHAQVNGSFYIDNLRGLINFSSNVSGKTVILDYISDSLGTDGEMQVHKFAEEAMYKWIMYAILSTRANTPEYIVRRYQKEKFAATRQAKLRLSNIKLEEITQIFRGKSKHIKH